MPVQYTNRKDQTYYLHQTSTRAGNPTYFFSMSDEGNLVDAVPPGYEPYENPNGLIFLRKIRAKLITDDEVAMVEKEVGRHRHLRFCRVDVKKETISVYTPNQDVEALSGLFSEIGYGRAHAQSALVQALTYSAEMRFTLVDKEKRRFVVQRRTYGGSLDEWLELRGPETLKNLLKYIKHLGKESFFELFPGVS
jgi:hypothetical protein